MQPAKYKYYSVINISALILPIIFHFILANTGLDESGINGAFGIFGVLIFGLPFILFSGIITEKIMNKSHNKYIWGTVAFVIASLLVCLQNYTQFT